MTTAKWYGQALKTLANNEWKFTADTIKCGLFTSSYTPDQDVHDYLDDLSNEVTGGGYSRVTLTTKSISYDATTNTLKFTCDNLLFSNTSGTNIRYAVFFKDTGTPSTSPLIGYVDLGSQTLTNIDFTITISASGLLTLTAS